MTVGSLNKDARGMMTDGEVLQVTAGPWAMWAVADMWIAHGIDHLDREPGGARPPAAALQAVAAAGGPLGAQGDLTGRFHLSRLWLSIGVEEPQCLCRLSSSSP